MSFKVEKISLNGRNLLEASAGTGKTFSVAVLALRLILEKKVQVNEILMVTFTEAATTELSERVGSFINKAYRYVNGSSIDVDVIANVVDQAIQSQGKDAVIEALQAARLLRDELNVFTIHSFCSQVLKQEAFATGQLFATEITGDESSFINQGLRTYWRDHISNLNKDLLSRLYEKNLLSFSLAYEVVKKYLERKIIAPHEYYDANFDLHNINFDQLEKECTQQKEACVPEELASFYNSEKTEQKLPKTAWNNLIGKADNVFDFILILYKKATGKNPPQYIPKSFDDQFLDLIKSTHNKIASIPTVDSKLASTIYHRASMFCMAYMQKLKLRKGVQSYNDMIHNLYDVVLQNKNLEMDSRFKAVFIDEFQDTDTFQSVIFESLFDPTLTSVFYVGDPKQSIYSFRGADLDSYNATKKDVTYSMSTNYRSSKQYVEAMNIFFSAESDFFIDENISYLKVDSIKDSEDKVNSEPIEIHNLEQSSDKNDFIKKVVLDLLHGEHRIGKEQRKIQPQDIALLTSSNDKAIEIQKSISSIGVPAVVLSDRSIFTSEENRVVRMILRALLDGKITTIKSIFSTILIGLSPEQLKNLDPSALLVSFSKITERYKDQGVYAALTYFLDLFDVKSNLTLKYPADKDRVISNYKQLAELCNKKEQETTSLEELIQWLIQQEKEKSTEGNEQRIESDHDSLQILTYHKSKGLEYNIVICSDLQMKPKKNDVYDYKDDVGKTYTSINKDIVPQLEKNFLEQEKEIRRVLYVALTRAKYKFIGLTHKTGLDKHFIGALLSKLNSINPEFVNVNAIEPDVSINKYQPDKRKMDFKPILEFDRKQFKPGVFVSSYSSLASHNLGVSYAKENVSNATDYDDFVFNQMPKGPVLGNFLHYLFENMDFTNPKLEYLLKKAQRRFGSHFIKDQHLPFYETLVNHTLNAELPHIDITLSSLKNSHKISEIEFYSDEDTLSEEVISSSFDKPIKLNQNSFKGIVKGFVDLTFEHKGKYYILDWKSNYIGNKLEDYREGKLDEAMTQANYHLQYYLYKKALNKYLKLLDPTYDPDQHFGGVYYVFLRGVRQGYSSGVYFHS